MTTRLRTCTLFLLAVMALTGCTSIVYDQTGETVAIYQSGEFQMLVNSTAPKTAAATEVAFGRMDLTLTGKRVNRFDARMVARTVSFVRVLVLIEEVNSAQTLVRIRWGEHGYLDPSRQLFDEIDAAAK